MRPVVWEPPEALSAAEQAVVGRIKRAKLFPFLRRQRRALFSVTFQEELATLYQESERGQPPVPPAKLALVTIIQAYTGASDDEAIEALTMDRRWQLVLDCLDAEQAPFGNVFASLVWVHRRFCCAGLAGRLAFQGAAPPGGRRQRGIRPGVLSGGRGIAGRWGVARRPDAARPGGHHA
jgi:hypothetical protein